MPAAYGDGTMTDHAPAVSPVDAEYAAAGAVSPVESTPDDTREGLRERISELEDEIDDLQEEIQDREFAAEDHNKVRLAEYRAILGAIDDLFGITNLPFRLQCALKEFEHRL
jgi:hypothetical protein